MPGENSYNFKSLKDLRYFIASRYVTAYSSDGLLLTFGRAPNTSNAVTVERACVNHRPPAGLAASPRSAINWTHATPEPATRAWYDCARTTYDPVADDRSAFDEKLDIERATSLWDATGYGCAVDGGKEPNGKAPPAPFEQDLALAPGETLSLENANGSLSVDAPTTTTRTLRWRNRRTSTPPNDYDTAPRTITVDLAATDRDTGAVGAAACNRLSGDDAYVVTYQEGGLNFADLADFRAWIGLADHTALYLDDTYTSDGMLASFHVGSDAGGRPLLAVDVIRLCVHGSQPAGLPGAGNARLRRADHGVRFGPDWNCPRGSLDLPGIYNEMRMTGEWGSPIEARLRAYYGLATAGT